MDADQRSAVEFSADEVRLTSKVQRTAIIRCSGDAQFSVRSRFGRNPHGPSELHAVAVHRVESAILVASAYVLAEDYGRRAEIAIGNQLTCGHGERAAKCQRDRIEL